MFEIDEIDGIDGIDDASNKVILIDVNLMN
jgi:hypothetical protein